MASAECTALESPPAGCHPQTVYLALPRRPGRKVPGEVAGIITLIRPVRRGRFKLGRAKISLLNHCFNRCWANMMNSRHEGLTHWGMQHDDIVPAPAWCDTLIDAGEAHGADVVSAVVPIKDDRGLTSTGVRDVETGHVRRLTMTEVMRLPETFDLADCLAAGITAGGDPGDLCLVVNTGLWVARLDRDWVEHFPGFQSVDCVRLRDDGRHEACCLPEDWCMSEWLARRGVRVVATRAVAVAHLDEDEMEKAARNEPFTAKYTNDHVWGEWETDRGDDPKV